MLGHLSSFFTMSKAPGIEEGHATVTVLAACLQQYVKYHWQELPQVSFLLRQKYACCDKTFVMRNMCLLRQIFVATKVLTQQKYFVAANITLLRQIFCRGEHTFVATKDMFCCDKHMLLS